MLFASKLYFQEKVVSGFLLSDEERQSLIQLLSFLEIMVIKMIS